MKDRLAPPIHRSRLAACIVAAGFLFAASAAAQTPLPPPQYGNADVRQDRIEELERELREATAANERLQYEIIQRDREITRLRSMVGELAGVNQSLSTPPADGATPPAAGAAPPLNAPPANQQTNLTGAQERAVGTLGTMPANTPIPQPDPATAYTQARDLLTAGRYAEAEVAFGQFLEAHPTAQQAPDARFWFAFTLLARNNYQDAAANFVQYLQRTPNGARAPEAQVRLGMALAGMGQQRQACGAFSNLTTRYPNAPRNVRDLATREARAANCAA